MNENSGEVIKERYEAFLTSKKRLLEDQTLSPAALKVAEFLYRSIESENDFVNSFNLSKLVRGGKFREELKLNGDDMENALNELLEKGYTLFY
jgi:hypothetical protein